MAHKCDGCKYKGEHQEMMFKPMGVCLRETNLGDAVKAYNAENCKFKVTPEQEIAIKIFSDIEKIAKTVGFPEALVNGMIVNRILDGLYIDSQDFAELKKKYTERGGEK